MVFTRWIGATVLFKRVVENMIVESGLRQLMMVMARMGSPVMVSKQSR